MPKAKPVVLTSVAPLSAAAADAQPLAVVTGTTAGSTTIVTKQAAIANQAAATLPADFAGVQTQLQSLTTKINAILAALRSAGILLP